MPISCKKNKHINFRSCGSSLINIVQHDEIGHVFFVIAVLLVCFNDGVGNIPKRCQFIMDRFLIKCRKNHNVKDVILLLERFHPRCNIGLHAELKPIGIEPVLIVHKGQCFGLAIWLLKKLAEGDPHTISLKRFSRRSISVP